MKLLFSLFFLLISALALGDDVVGFWKTVDEQSGKPRSIVAIYEYEGKYYGRLIETFDDYGNIQDTINAPKVRAPGVKGNPYYSGLDFIWGLQENGSKYTGGKIMDPEKGKIYGAEMWTEDGNLIVRGKILFFGRNQVWPPATIADFPPNFKKPDLTAMVPSIPEVN